MIVFLLIQKIIKERITSGTLGQHGVLVSYLSYVIEPRYMPRQSTKIKQAILLCIAGMLINCQHENVQIYPADFEYYVDEFFHQAVLHGREMHPANFDFSIEFGDIDDQNAAVCNTLNKRITVDEEYWKTLDTLQQEALIFHELGHCLLRRPHNNAISANICNSFMFGHQDIQCSHNYYSQLWREYYLDELFHSINIFPDWYLNNQVYNNDVLNYSHKFVWEDTLVEKLELETFSFTQRAKFFLEIEFKNQDPEERSVQCSLGNLSFSYCDDCVPNTVSLRHVNGKKVYYRGGFEKMDTNSRLTILKNHNIISFFINGVFVHAMESDLIKGSAISTNRFENMIRLDISLGYASKLL